MRSEVEAFKWFELAAEEGSSDAQSNLGEIQCLLLQSILIGGWMNGLIAFL